jgi:deazaflavin-dependent oxidoreductase (nitroreductase family)
MTRDQVELYERTDGMEGATMQGGPVVILTMRGARSGKLRKVALMRIERDGVYAVGASAGGQVRHPNWFHNLVAHPTVQLQDRGDRRLMTARVIEGAERDSWIEYADELYPFFVGLRERAADNDREVPLVLLEPIEDRSAATGSRALSGLRTGHCRFSSLLAEDSGGVHRLDVDRDESRRNGTTRPSQSSWAVGAGTPTCLRTRPASRPTC